MKKIIILFLSFTLVGGLSFAQTGPQVEWQPGFYNSLQETVRQALLSTTRPLTTANAYNFLLLSEMSGLQGCFLTSHLTFKDLEIALYDEKASTLHLYKIPLRKAWFSSVPLKGVEGGEVYMLIFDQENKYEKNLVSESYVMSFFLKNDGSQLLGVTIDSTKNMVNPTFWEKIRGITPEKREYVPGVNIRCQSDSK